MAPRRHPLLLLLALALVLSSFAIAPRPVQAATHIIKVDTVLDLTVEDTAELLNQNYCPVPAPDAPAADPAQRTCSLRRAIVRALSLPDADIKLIVFNFFTDGNIPRAPFELTAPPILPAIDKDNVRIVADTTVSFGRPVIEIDGRGKPVGLQLEARQAYISGVSIYGFRDNSIQPFNGSAIYITGEGNTIETSFIGVRSDGSMLPDDQKNYSGIHLGPGARDNVIGGPGPAAISNYISGNVQNGVIITNASDNTIQNNVVGLIRATGDVIEAPGNGAYGIQITSSGAGNVSSGNVIGGASDGQTIRYNIIAQSGQAGIYLRGAGTTTNTIQANYIGLDRQSNDRGNLGDGVRIEAGASRNSFSGASSLNPLVISGSRGYGVNIRAFGAGAPVGNSFSGYIYIGTNTTGAVTANPNPLRNYLGGVRITEQARDTAFESPPGALRIVGNGGPGITIQGSTVSGTRITGAQIGGAGALTNSGAGVSITQASTTELRGSTIIGNSGLGVSVSQARETIVATSTISGNTAGGLLLDATNVFTLSENLISNNTNFGLRLSAALTTTISANTIGLDTPRRNPLANQGPGIELLNTINTRIVGDNYIAANTGLGLLVSGGSVVEVGENSFGLRRDPAQSDQPILAAPNGGAAQIRVADGARQVEIRGNRLAGGAASSSAPPGLLIEGATTQDINVRSNQIGLQFTVGQEIRTFAHGDGIAVNGARIVTIGGGNLSDSNLIRYNFGAAIRLTDSFNTNIRNNNDSQAIFKNGGDGIVLVTTSDGRQVGSQSIVIENNQLAENAGNAIAIRGEPTTPIIADVQVLSNTLRANAGYGIFVGNNVDRASFRGNLLRGNGGPIRLVETTRYNPNTGANPGDPNRPNHDIDPPWVNVGAVNDQLRLRLKDNGIIEGYVITSTNRLREGAPPASACVTCTLQIFQPFSSEPANLGQGGLLVGSSGLSGAVESSFRADPSTGFFSRQIGDNLASIPELLLVATDGFVNGNSSEYATFPISRGLIFEQPPILGTVGTPLTISKDAAPGDVLTYTMQLRNPGSLTLTRPRLSVSGLPSTWRIVTDPPLGILPTELADGQVLPVTVTLTLPTGSDATVRAGLTQVITLAAVSDFDATVTASARLQARMLERPVLSLTPLTSLRSARPGSTTDHLHVVRNNGNVAVTVNFAAATRDNLGPTTLWTTTLNKSSTILGPGEEDSLRVTVLVPQGTAEGTEAVTTVTVTVPANPSAGYGEIMRTATDTTRASLAATADLSGGTDQEAAAGAVVSFAHTVFNRSNGVADFCLSYTTNKGSTARFVSATDGFVIRPNGCFTLDTVNDERNGRFRDAEFRVIVTVGNLLLPGELETINIELRAGSPTGDLIGDATATNTVRITRGQVQPRIWLPLVRR